MADEKLEEAIDVFEQALRIEPDNVENSHEIRICQVST